MCTDEDRELKTLKSFIAVATLKNFSAAKESAKRAADAIVDMDIIPRYDGVIIHDC